MCFRVGLANSVMDGWAAGITRVECILLSLNHKQSLFTSFLSPALRTEGSSQLIPHYKQSMEKSNGNGKYWKIEQGCIRGANMSMTSNLHSS